MDGQQLGTLAIELYFSVLADVYLSEIVLVEVGILQHFIFSQEFLVQNLLFLQLLFCSIDKPGGIQCLVLRIDGALLGNAVGTQQGHIRLQAGNHFVQFSDADVLGSQFSLQGSQLLCLLGQLCRQVVHRLLHLRCSGSASLQLLLQLSNLFAVLLHGLRNEGHVLLHLVERRSRSFTSHPHATFSLVYQAESFLNGIEGVHKFFQLGILLTERRLQRIVLLLQVLLFVSKIVASSKHGCTCDQ